MSLPAAILRRVLGSVASWRASRLSSVRIRRPSTLSRKKLRSMKPPTTAFSRLSPKTATMVASAAAKAKGAEAVPSRIHPSAGPAT